MLNDAMIGGAMVRRLFYTADGVKRSGTRLSREDVLAIRPANRRALVSAGVLELFPLDPQAKAHPIGQANILDPIGTERIIVSTGRGKYHVIEGRRLNAEPLSQKEAQALLKVGHTPTEH